VLASNKVVFYADWTADEDDLALAEEQKDPQTGKNVRLTKDVAIYHLPFDDFNWRGNGLLNPSAGLVARAPPLHGSARCYHAGVIEVRP
jgi:hypothetical protein